MIIQKITDKNKCIDIFRDVEVMINKNETQMMYEPKSEQKFLYQKMKRTGDSNLYDTLALILNLKSLIGILHVKAMLIKIEQAKKLFILDMSDGCEVFIPKDLSQTQYPMSYRYYDPLIQIVQQRIADDRKDFYKLKNTMKQQCYEKIDQTRRVLEDFGLVESKKESLDKLTFKYS